MPVSLLFTRDGDAVRGVFDQRESTASDGGVGAGGGGITVDHQRRHGDFREVSEVAEDGRGGGGGAA